MPIPAPPSIAAKSYLLIDFNSDQVLMERDLNKRIEPASITKLMTAYVVYNELEKGTFNDTDLVTVSEKAWRMKGSRMFIEVGKQVSVKDLLRGLTIQSGNDASVALAEFVAGSEDSFVSHMNLYADRLGMSNTHFMNSTGLPHKEHYTSAKDLAKLVRALINNFPEHYKMYAEKQFVYNNIPQYNRNKLLWSDSSVDGLKTGHTQSAGYCLASSAKRGDMRLIAILLGAKSKKARARESQKMLDYGFRFFRTYKLYSKDQVLNRARIWKGEVSELPLGVSDDFYITIPRDQYGDLKANMELQEPITAPITQGTALGTVQVHLFDKLVKEQPLVALKEVAEGNFFQRSWDTVLESIDSF
ncbi:MAG: D-alanyl-D-alanine carboxypeptidase family protein [Gammaproteobacteria bacterium]|nr:D-alanyl-D-alanine carboxypeptidase family protein [Gammaproteobacteria bacterium]